MPTLRAVPRRFAKSIGTDRAVTVYRRFIRGTNGIIATSSSAAALAGDGWGNMDDGRCERFIVCLSIEVQFERWVWVSGCAEVRFLLLEMGGGAKRGLTHFAVKRTFISATYVHVR